MAYSDEVVKRFENPTHAGKLDKDDPNVGTALSGSPACGDVIRLQIRVDPHTENIIEARWKGFGCGALMSSAQLMCEMLEGRNIDDAERMKNTQIVDALCLMPVKIHCSILAEDAIKSAIADFRSKQAAAASLSSHGPDDLPDPSGSPGPAPGA